MCIGGGGGESPPTLPRPPTLRSLRVALGVTPTPQSLAWWFPLCPRHPAEGAGGGVVSRLPPATTITTTTTTTPPRQKSAPPLRANGLSSCDSVLPSGGRVAEGLLASPQAITLRLREQRSLCSWDPFLCPQGSWNTGSPIPVSPPPQLPSSLFCQPQTLRLTLWEVTVSPAPPPLPPALLPFHFGTVHWPFQESGLYDYACPLTPS